MLLMPPLLIAWRAMLLPHAAIHAVMLPMPAAFSLLPSCLLPPLAAFELIFAAAA